MHKRLLPAIINISSNGFTRSLMDQNGTLTTIKLVNTRTKTTLNVQSDEFAIKLANGQVITARDYTTDVVDTPSPSTTTIQYTKRKNLRLNTDAPTTITVTFTKTAAGIQKSIHFSLQTSTTPLHIEVERFTTTKQATRGGRGEPVVIGNSIVLLPENPTMLTRHTDGNQPTAYAHRFERVGNHSFIDYAGADQEAKPTPGLVRAFHFPIPQPATNGPGFVIQSQTITGIAIKKGLSAEQTVSKKAFPQNKPSFATAAPQATHAPSPTTTTGSTRMAKISEETTSTKPSPPSKSHSRGAASASMRWFPTTAGRTDAPSGNPRKVSSRTGCRPSGS